MLPLDIPCKNVKRSSREKENNVGQKLRPTKIKRTEKGMRKGKIKTCICVYV